jgi:DnaJ homolog subfamily C member 19
MILYLIIGIVLLFCCYALLQWFAQAEPRAIFRTLKWVLVSVLILAIIFLALSGKLGLAVAALPALFVWILRFRVAINIWRSIKDMIGLSKPSANKQKTGSGSGFEGAMTREEALSILGLEEGALPAEIKAAYHRLISKAHPDKGGTDYLAAKINQAKDILLK